MGKVRRIQINSSDQLPSAKAILAVVTRDDWAVVEFSNDLTSADLHAIQVRYRAELPEYFSVFESGSKSITLMQVISRLHISRIQNLLVESVQHFRETATELATHLAEANGIKPDELWNHSHKLRTHSPEWNLEVHGVHCAFRHVVTDQRVEVNILFGPEFGVLDPFFWHDYIRTTPGLRPPAEFRHDYHDPSRALDVLEERGKLQHIRGFWGETGLTVRTMRRGPHG